MGALLENEDSKVSALQKIPPRLSGQCTKSVRPQDSLSVHPDKLKDTRQPNCPTVACSYDPDIQEGATTHALSASAQVSRYYLVAGGRQNGQIDCPSALPDQQQYSQKKLCLAAAGFELPTLPETGQVNPHDYVRHFIHNLLKIKTFF